MRRPADFLDAAAEIRSLPHGAIPAHLRDQYDAASRDVADQFAQLAEFLPYGGTPQEVTTEVVAWRLALRAALIARLRYSCIHWETRIVRPYHASLTGRLVACDECFPAAASVAMATIDPNDGVCDVCDEPGTHFTPCMTKVANVIYDAFVCDECLRWGLAE